MPDNKLQKILYVEDDPDIQMIALIALENVGGFTVSTASSGIEALTLAVKDQPDLILLDVMMPKMDGLETIRQLRANEDTSEIPVIFMTAKTQDERVMNYRTAGAAGVIQKPFDPMTLADQVRKIWQQIH